MKTEHNERVGETITVTNTQPVLFPVILKITHQWMKQRLQLSLYSNNTEFELLHFYRSTTTLADVLETS